MSACPCVWMLVTVLLLVALVAILLVTVSKFSGESLPGQRKPGTHKDDPTRGEIDEVKYDRRLHGCARSHLSADQSRGRGR